ncbi:hypothetical protein ACJMK2_016766 [Sinanodonta woodiana]|uniref:Dynein regulatory complex subunit 6 n=1 Tax=Sinanodonta woodiana TaxID=1069815 RepID=A0ABD3UY73_SINWO
MAAASMKSLPHALKAYLRHNKLPDVYEALLTGLAVMCPEDPEQFIIDKLKGILEGGLENLSWDMFVAEDMKPPHKVVSESNLDFIFHVDDENMIPTPEMLALAYEHYNIKLKRMCFSGWLQFYLLRRRKLIKLDDKTSVAIRHHSHRLMKVHLTAWIEWVKFRKGRQAMSYQKLRHVFFVAWGRLIFRAWHKDTLDARLQREYFEIFSYLDVADLSRCARVCRSWKIIAQASSLWCKLNFYKVRNSVTDKVVTKLLLKCRPYLMHLNMRGCQQLSEISFISLAQCRNLQDLNLSDCLGVNDETIKIVAKRCKILLYLNLSYTSITDASIRTIAKWCSNLQYLSMAFCKNFTDRGLLYLACGKCSKKLNYIDLSGCLQLTPDGFKNLSSGCTSLQTLMMNDFPTLNDDCILPVAENCSKISTVSFLGSPLLTDEAFKKLAESKKLKKIKIDGNHRISDLSVKAIGACPELNHIYMTDCQRLTDASLKAIADCKQLVVVNFADCVRITVKGVRQLVEGQCAPSLRELNLTNCIRVSDLAMLHITKRCPNLTYLSICYCEHITESGIEMLGQTKLTSLDISGCNCGETGLSALGNNQRLRDVILSECVAITDLGLQKFAQSCKDLERLDISHCSNITDGAIKNLAFCCRNINYLNLSGCQLITDLSIQYLSGVCHYLMHLDISGCPLVTEKALRYLRKGCKKLRTLVIMYCKGIDKPHAQKIRRHVEDVQYSDDPIPSYFGYS